MSAQGDYRSVLASGVVPAGQKSIFVTVPVVGDTLYELDETMKLAVGLPTNARISTTTGVAKATGKIRNDDAAPTIAITDVQQTEGNSGTRNVVLTVTLSTVSGVKATVKYATVDDTATAGSGYSVAILPGQLSGLITVSVKGDTVVEADERFKVNLSSPVRATIATAQAITTILNDD